MTPFTLPDLIHTPDISYHGSDTWLFEDDSSIQPDRSLAESIEQATDDWIVSPEATSEFSLVSEQGRELF